MPGPAYIDSHCQLYDITKTDKDFPTPDLTSIYKNFTVDDYKVAKNDTFIRYAIVVNITHQKEELKWLLEEAEKSDFIKGIVPWVDLTSATLENDLLELASSPLVVGVRHLIDRESDDWITSDDVKSGLKILENAGLAFDLRIRPKHLKYAAEIVKEFPRLWFSVNHCAKPSVKDKVGDEEWKEGMAELAKYPNVFCKLSGLVTEADPKAWKSEDLKPYIEHCLDVFGYNRCIYGSNWPMMMLAEKMDLKTDFDTMLELVTQCLEGDSKKVRMVFRENAIKFYGIIPRDD